MGPAIGASGEGVPIVGGVVRLGAVHGSLSTTAREGTHSIMVTRIKSVTVGKLGRISRQRAPKADSDTGTPASSAARSDDVVFSSDARVIAKADEAAAQAPDIRMDLVGPIREAVMAGRYRVSSLDVADKILRQVLMDRKKSF